MREHHLTSQRHRDHSRDGTSLRRQRNSARFSEPKIKNRISYRERVLLAPTAAMGLHAPLLEACRSQSSASRLQLALLVSLFVLWGACNALNDVLIRQFKKAFTLTDAQSGLVQTAFYCGYFLGALPAAWVARRHGYKVCVCLGLGLVCAGSALFWPSSRGAAPWYASLLGCLYLLAFGLAFLECSANPWIVLLAERRRAGSGTRALNLAQSFNPLGSVGGVLLGRTLILGSDRVEAVGSAYLVLGLIFAAISVGFALTRFPAGDGRASGSARQPLRAAVLLGCLRHRGFCRGLAAQFVCIGAQTCVWSYQIRYTRAVLPAISDQRAADFLLASLTLFLVGRFASSAVLRCVAADVLLCAQCTLAAALCVLVWRSADRLGALALCAVSPCFGMAFPTIFALSLAQLDPDRIEVGASLLVMAIVGGCVPDGAQRTHARSIARPMAHRACPIARSAPPPTA